MSERPGTAFEEETAADEAAADRALGEIVLDVTEKVLVLVREEIELAKAEVSEKVNRILRGAVVGIVAGALAFLSLILLMHGVAWLINDLLFDDALWAGFLIEAGLFLLLAIGGGFYAFRAFKRGAPPTPEMAIAEAREIGDTLKGGG